MINMTNEEIIEKWIKTFASNVPTKIMKENVFESGNHLWHIFTWGNAPCIERDEARKAFGALPPCNVIMFKGGYSINDKPHITDVQMHQKKPSVDWSVQQSNFKDVYFVDEHFQWTYVQTHESDCGPYFSYLIT